MHAQITGLAALTKLETLDLSDNFISCVSGLDCLPILSTLNLSGNKVCFMAVRSPSLCLYSNIYRTGFKVGQIVHTYTHTHTCAHAHRCGTIQTWPTWRPAAA